MVALLRACWVEFFPKINKRGAMAIRAQRVAFEATTFTKGLRTSAILRCDKFLEVNFLTNGQFSVKQTQTCLSCDI